MNFLKEDLEVRERKIQREIKRRHALLLALNKYFKSLNYHKFLEIAQRRSLNLREGKKKILDWICHEKPPNYIS